MRCNLTGGTVLAALVGCGSDHPGPALYPDSETILWSQALGPEGVGKPRRVTPPAIGSDGIVYAGGGDPEARDPPIACLYAFDPGGELKNRVCGSQGDYRGAPVMWVAASPSGRGAYAVDEAGGLYAIRPDGTTTYRMLPDAPRWEMDPILAGPIVVSGDERLYVGGGGAVYIIDIEDAHQPVKWSFRPRVVAPEAPLPIVHASFDSAGRTYASGSKLYAFNPSGLRVWEVETWAGTEGGPVPGYEGYLIARFERGIAALSSAGQVVWKFDPGEVVLGTVRLDHHWNVYFCADRSVHGVDPAGRPRWQVSHDRPFTGAILLRGETLYCSDTSGDVHAFGLDGRKLWKISVGHNASTPAADEIGTKLYVTTDEPRLYALKPRSGG
jgi:outer membrane protein assembly factor BamB